MSTRATARAEGFLLELQRERFTLLELVTLREHFDHAILHARHHWDAQYDALRHQAEEALRMTCDSIPFSGLIDSYDGCPRCSREIASGGAAQ